VTRVGQRSLETAQGRFDCHLFKDRSVGLHMALTKGQWLPTDEVLVRVHEPLSVLDLLDAGSANNHSWPLAGALSSLQAAERGVAVLLNCGRETGEDLLQQLLPPANQAPVRPAVDLRTYGVGAQILRELGVSRMRLLGSPRRMPSMTGFGLEVTGFSPAE